MNEFVGCNGDMEVDLMNGVLWGKGGVGSGEMDGDITKVWLGDEEIKDGLKWCWDWER